MRTEQTRSGVGVALALSTLLAIVWLAVPVQAYVGPGAGIAVVSSLFVVLTTIIIAILALLTWPFRMLWKLVRRRRKRTGGSEY